MWAHVTFKRASVKRFRTAIGLTGQLLVQEINGSQLKTQSAMGCTVDEYTVIVRETEADEEFQDELQVTASEQIRPGIACLQVETSATRKLAPGETDDAEYVYTPGQCG